MNSYYLSKKNSIEFLVIGRIPKFCFVQLLTKECYELSFLAKDTPIPTPDASQLSSNILSKLGKARIGASVNFLFKSWKLSWASSIHTKDFCLRQLVRGAAMVLKLLGKMGFCPYFIKNLTQCPYFETILQNVPIFETQF